MSLFSRFFTPNRSDTALILGADMHSHLLPGIDDGAKNIDSSLQLIRGLQTLGYTKLITTPHIYKEYYPNTKAGILQTLEILQAAAAQTDDIHIPISASAEYFMDEHFEELLAKNEFLPLAEHHLLVEMSFFGAPPKLDEYLFRIQTLGYEPILAHPERYIFMHGDMSIYEKLKDQGCLLQVNLLSLLGYYGAPVAQIAKKLLKADMIDLVGTDLHHEQHLRVLQQGLSQRIIRDAFERTSELQTALFQ
jgi:protein-tyrosine phosphatase